MAIRQLCSDRVCRFWADAEYSGPNRAHDRHCTDAFEHSWYQGAIGFGRDADAGGSLEVVVWKVPHHTVELHPKDAWPLQQPDVLLPLLVITDGEIAIWQIGDLQAYSLRQAL